MKKLNHLREYLINAIPALKRSPERLLVFVENGSISYHDGGNLSHQYSFPARLVITDWHEDVDKFMLPVLEWLTQFEPGFNPVDVIRFDAEILNHEKVDLALTINLTEKVIVKKSCDGTRVEITHVIPTPPTVMDCDARLEIKVQGPAGGFTLPDTSAANPCAPGGNL